MALLRFDPEAIPPDPAFADPAVRGHVLEPERLTPQALRARFARPQLLWQPDSEFDLRPDLRPSVGAGVDEPRPAAVLIPLVVRDDGLQVLLTQRTAHLSDHAGQISFPGGRIEATDANPVAAALRESQEEIGLDPVAVEVMGTLPHYLTATHYRVTPVVGLIERLPRLTPDEFEVAEIFEVPFQFLMNPAHHERRLAEWQGQRRSFFAMPYVPSELSTQRRFIWGATAAMLRNLYRFLSVS